MDRRADDPADAVLRTPRLILRRWRPTDRAPFAAMNEIYSSYFSAPYPARSTVQVVKLPRDVRVEIDVIAVVG